MKLVPKAPKILHEAINIYVCQGNIIYYKRKEIKLIITVVNAVWIIQGETNHQKDMKIQYLGH